MTSMTATLPIVGLILLSCPAFGAAKREDKPPAVTRFLVVGKSKIADPQEQQQKSVEAVRKVASAARSGRREGIVEALAEKAMTISQYRRGLATEEVTGAIFKARLRRLAEVATAQDTVFVYTHSHGRKNGFEETQALGGIVLDLPVRQPKHGGTLLWDEYADLLLKIPAKNVVVLTMSCFSGGFADYLQSKPVLERWKERRAKEGRNFVVLTSQNESLTSEPILIDGEIVNPFTYAVTKALAGEADGFSLASGKPVSGRPKDGKLSVGELVDFVLYTTENAVSERRFRKNTARPKGIGSFDREDVLLEKALVEIVFERRRRAFRFPSLAAIRSSILTTDLT